MVCSWCIVIAEMGIGWWVGLCCVAISEYFGRVWVGILWLSGRLGAKMGSWRVRASRDIGTDGVVTCICWRYCWLYYQWRCHLYYILRLPMQILSTDDGNISNTLHTNYSWLLSIVVSHLICSYCTCCQFYYLCSYSIRACTLDNTLLSVLGMSYICRRYVLVFDLWSIGSVCVGCWLGYGSILFIYYIYVYLCIYICAYIYIYVYLCDDITN